MSANKQGRLVNNSESSRNIQSRAGDYMGLALTCVLHNFLLQIVKCVTETVKFQKRLRPLGGGTVCCKYIQTLAESQSMVYV